MHDRRRGRAFAAGGADRRHQGLRGGRDTFIFAPVGLGMAQQSERRLSLAEARGQPVYRMAGAGPEDMDLLGLYDSFSPLPLYALEDFGYCEAGEALSWVQGGRIGIGGERPVNTAGSPTVAGAAERLGTAARAGRPAARRGR